MYRNFYYLKSIKFATAAFFVFSAVLLSMSLNNYAQQEEQQPTLPEGKVNLLKLLNIEPSKESIDFILNRTQAQRHELLTEQPHQKTTYLSEMTKKDFEIVIDMLVSVDEDIELVLKKIKKEKLHQLADSIEDALISGNKIYIYDCSSTGWTSKTIESVFWRPFWEKVKQEKKIWEKVKTNLSENIEEYLIGEITAGDLAFLAPVDTLEELKIMGRLQIIESNIGSKDIVIGVSESGQEPAVIGTLVSALDLRKKDKTLLTSSSKNKLFFIYNNPDEKITLYESAKQILKEPAVTKINLTTGPQTVAGHTAMQASTINTYTLGIVIQTAVESTLRKFLSGKDMSKLGFEEPLNLDKSLERFSEVLRQIKKSGPELAALSRLESEIYNAGHITTYMANEGFFTTFVQSISRNRFFCLHPFDTINNEKGKSRLQLWCQVETPEAAWILLLGRSFRPIDGDFYTKFLTELIDDQELITAALEIIKQTGNDPQKLYDFSYGNFNLVNRAPKAADLGVLIVMTPEEEELENKHSAFVRFLDLHQGRGAFTGIIYIAEDQEKEFEKTVSLLSRLQPKGPLVKIRLEEASGPFKIDQRTALKMLLDIHSAAVMAGSGNIIRNTPSETAIRTFSQIDRATFLIQNYVNQTLRHPRWVKKHGVHNPINYGEANAVLFDSLKFLKKFKTSDSEKRIGVVTLSTIRILESLRVRRSVSLEETLKIAGAKGLSRYLSEAEK